jgi:hypothetical protein
VQFSSKSSVQFSSVQFCHASNIYKVFDGTPWAYTLAEGVPL